MKELHEALGILLKYDPEGRYSVYRNAIYASSILPEDMSDTDFDRMEILGWRYCDIESGWMLDIRG